MTRAGRGGSAAMACGSAMLRGSLLLRGWAAWWRVGGCMAFLLAVSAQGRAAATIIARDHGGNATTAPRIRLVPAAIADDKHPCGSR